MFSITNATRASAVLNERRAAGEWGEVIIAVTGVYGERTDLRLHVEAPHLPWARRLVASINAANVDPAALPAVAAE